MIFGFSLCAVSLQVIQIIYFRLETTRRWQDVLLLTPRREVLVLVDFQNNYQYQLLDYILVSMPKVAIWNVTAKQVTHILR